MKRQNLFLLVFTTFALVGCNHMTDDEKQLNELNNILKEDADNITTCHDAIKFLAKKDIDIENYEFKDKEYSFGFDIDAKKFLLIKDNKISLIGTGYQTNKNPYHIFKVVDNYDNRIEFSQYLTNKFSGSDLLVVTTGLDMGDNKNVKNITYFNNSEVTKEVLLNINCDYLNISAPNDKIYHLGSANNVFIPSNSKGEFHEYGECSYIQASGGDVYLEDGSYADIFEVPTGCTPTLHQSENSNILARFNAEIRAQSNIRCKEIDNSDIKANELQALLDDTSYNFYRLTTEARDIKLDDSKIEFKRNLFFDLNGRSITFDLGDPNGVKFDEDGTVYYPAIHVHGNTAISAFLLDTQSSLYQRSGINLLDCSIIIEGNADENKPVNFYMNSGKVHDVKCTSRVGDYRNRPAILVMGNVEDNKDRPERHSAFYMYGGYIKTEWGAKADDALPKATVPEDTYRKRIACKCIQPRGNGASVNMVYGDLDSFHYCISGQGRSANNVDRYGKTLINITGGYLTGGKEPAYDDDTHESIGYQYTPLFFPQSGEVNISGANFTGPTCINAKAGTINITGGIFNATGDYNKDAKAGQSGSAGDGSVIFMESNGFYQGAFDNPLNINVKDTTMISKNGYIVKGSGYKYLDKYCKSSINFASGTFNYKLDKYAVDEEIKDNYFECSINGGTWTQHE